MELFLNFAWLALAASMCCLWVRCAPHRSNGRPADLWMQLVALAVLILILFPVISITDDLQAAQNLAETDTCACRDHECSAHHSIFLAAAASLPLPIFETVPASLIRSIALDARSTAGIQFPPLSAFQNLPPPSA